MKLALFLAILALLLIHLIFSLLALLQAKRFSMLSRSNPWVTWTYIVLTLSIDATIIVIFLQSPQ